MKKIILLGALLIIIIASTVCGYTFTDTFNRDNSNTVGNGWTEGESAATDISITSNQARLDKTVANAYLRRAAFNNISNLSFSFETTSASQEFDLRIGVASGTSAIYLYTLDGNLNCHEDPSGKKALVAIASNTHYTVNISGISNATRHYNVTVGATTYGCKMFTGQSLANLDFIVLGTQVVNIDYFSMANETDVSIPTPPVVTVQYPEESTSYNDSWNGSIILSTDKVADCAINYTAAITTGQTTHRYDITRTDGVYTVAYSCNYSYAWANDSFWFFYDGTDPILTLHNPLNNSVQYGSFNLSLDFYDSYLFQTNVTIRNSTGGLIFWNSSGDIIDGRTNWTINKFINVSTFPKLDYYLGFFEATDSHTAQSFNEALIFTKDTKAAEINKATLKLSEANVKIEYPKGMDITTEKTTDRFVLSYSSPSITGETYFTLEAPKLVYLKNSGYQGHFIIFGEDGRPYYWFDTEGLKQTKITEISKNKYQIFYIQDKQTVISRSLGGLNYKNWTINFTIDNTDGRAEIVHSGKQLLGFLNVSKPKNIIFYTWYKDGVNVSSGNISTVATTRVNVNNYSLTDIGTYVFSARSTDGIYSTDWLNSTPYITGFISVNFFDEPSLNPFDYSTITAALIGVNVDYSVQKTTTNGSLLFDSLSVINDTLFELRYYAAEHLIRSRFIDLSTYANETPLCYLLNDSISAKLDVIVRDFSLIGIPNATVTVQRFYPNITQWLTVAQGMTNILGSTRFYLEKDAVYYRFIVTYLNRTIFTSSGEIITADTETYRITTDISSVYTAWENLEGDVSYSNATGSPTFTFAYENKGTNILSVNLEVYQAQQNGAITLWATNTSTATDDTITIIVTDTDVYHIGLIRIDYTGDNYFNYLDGATAEYIPPPPAAKEDFKPLILIVYLILFPAIILGALFISRRLLAIPIGIAVCALIAYYNPLWQLFPFYTMTIIVFGMIPLSYYLNKVQI